MKVPVVVLNMHYSGLGIARGLAPHGIPVHGLGAHADFPGNSSRYCTFQLSPDSLLEPDGLEAFLIDYARRFTVRPILFPTRDHDIDFLLKHRTALDPYYVIPMAPNEVLERALNKDLCFSIARDCGIALPRSYTVQSNNDLANLRDHIQFPVIVKPLYARHWRRPGIWEAVGQQKAAQFDSWSELDAFYRRIEPLEPIATVQEYVPGPDRNLVIFGSYCRSGGEVRAFFTGRKLLQVPPLRGTGVIVEGVPIDLIVEPSRRLLAALNFSGMSEIEYKVHERTGVVYLIEVNPRHWDQHFLGTACGVNLSLEWYRDVTECFWPLRRDATEPPPIQESTPVRWLAEQDLAMYAVASVVRGDGAWGDLGRLIRGRRTYSVLRRDDPLPAIRQFSGIARDLCAVVRGRLGRWLASGTTSSN